MTLKIQKSFGVLSFFMTTSQFGRQCIYFVLQPILVRPGEYQVGTTECTVA